MPFEGFERQRPEVTAPQRHPLTLEALAEWLEKQPPAQPYNYTSVTTCMLAQYHQACGLGFGPWRLFTSRVRRQMEFQVAADHPRTMGAALARCRNLIAKRT